MLIQFPFLVNLMISLYIWSTYPWPDYCQGFLSMSTAALLLVSSVILYPFHAGDKFSTYAIATNSVEYGFCSALTPSVTEKVVRFSFR